MPPGGSDSHSKPISKGIINYPNHQVANVDIKSSRTLLSIRSTTDSQYKIIG